ncbi:hypothetical protein F906_00276 [Acinetobacter pseudolwoffii]|uniref:Beta-lactamase-related domain-containing protein n=1 Tax=Acinetobacter pseudolwoffii TaxID=2053287 RepID=N9KWE5_9GAMM|nr:serine hydrolase domain-containing protein [Acinetobacter pseudolwoffii]ENW88367.1 hypothetical protein F906_00276 [Acinetobacter pseudolwoffii]
MFNNIKIKDLLTITLIIIGVALTSHFYLIDRLGFWRLIYPVQAQIASMTSQCSPQTPIWMKQAMHYAIHEQKNLSNQLAFIDANQQLHHCESGWRGTAVFSEKLQPEHRFRYASLTKTLTSHAVLDLIQQKRLTLDTRLIDLFEELKQMDYQDPRIQNITLGQLLEHRSGFDRIKSEDVVFAINKKSWCPDNLTALTMQRLDFDPDAKYAYDNRNYCLLGAVVERLSGQSYRSYMTQHYPLAQYNMQFVDGVYFADEVQYDFRNNDFWMPIHDNQFDFKALSSSAGLSGSASALATVLSNLLKNKKFDLLAISPQAKTNCQVHQFESCNGYTMLQYQPSATQPLIYFRRGGLPAVTSLAMITQNKEVIVWMGNGASSYKKHNDLYHLERYFYQLLNKQ